MLLPTRISQRLTMGSIVLLLLTGLAVFGVMSLRGQPRVVAASQELIEQTGSSIVRQLALKLASIEGITLSLAHLAEVLPHEQALYLNSLPNLIDNNGDLTIAGGGIWPEPDKFVAGSTRHSFSGPVVAIIYWLIQMTIMRNLALGITMILGIQGHARVLYPNVYGLKLIRIPLRKWLW